jgi:succinate dehydrogenase/fumarate reductase flavoprotein subunit
MMSARRHGPIDILVIGGGMAGLTAAARLAREGRSVALVEKGVLGGTAVHAGYIWTAATAGVLRYVNPRGEPALIERLAEGFQQGVEWVRSLGVDCKDAVDVLTYGRGHQTDLPGYLRACEQLVRKSPRCEILLSTVTERLIVEDGQVKGAVLKLATGEQRELRAAFTILATGGFQANPELRATLIHENARNIPVRSNWYSTGDGLRLAQAAGGAMWHPNAGFYGHLFPGGVTVVENDDFTGLAQMYSEHGVLFNLDGQRFTDETEGDHLTTMQLVQQREARGLLIIDSRVREQWMLKPYVPGHVPRDNFDIAYRRGARCAVAESLDDLVHLPEEWGYDGQRVRDAMLRFNADCRRGEFTPPRRRDAMPIDQPPFYVMEVVPAITFTFTGLSIDRDARVLREDGSAVPGLLAAGADVGGVFDRAYAGGLASALVFGMTAARTAASSLGD